ncbi:hypothetical protein GF351_04555 [Candidatus Woesearchaeota archaeon]|nr:hypothetical protein [Candidatus Woesearchaeota archaeon]
MEEAYTGTSKRTAEITVGNLFIRDEQGCAEENIRNAGLVLMMANVKAKPHYLTMLVGNLSNLFYVLENDGRLDSSSCADYLKDIMRRTFALEEGIGISVQAGLDELVGNIGRVSSIDDYDLVLSLVEYAVVSRQKLPAYVMQGLADDLGKVDVSGYPDITRLVKKRVAETVMKSPVSARDVVQEATAEADSLHGKLSALGSESYFLQEHLASMPHEKAVVLYAKFIDIAYAHK